MQRKIIEDKDGFVVRAACKAVGDIHGQGVNAQTGGANQVCNLHLAWVGRKIKARARPGSVRIGVPMKQPAVLTASEDVVRVNRMKLYIPYGRRVGMLQGTRIFALQIRK